MPAHRVLGRAMIETRNQIILTLAIVMLTVLAAVGVGGCEYKVEESSSHVPVLVIPNGKTVLAVRRFSSLTRAKRVFDADSVQPQIPGAQPIAVAPDNTILLTVLKSGFGNKRLLHEYVLVDYEDPKEMISYREVHELGLEKVSDGKGTISVGDGVNRRVLTLKQGREGNASDGED